MRMRVSPIDVRVRMGDAIGPFQLANGFEAVIGYECQERSNPLSLILTMHAIHARCDKASEWVGGSFPVRNSFASYGASAVTRTSDRGHVAEAINQGHRSGGVPIRVSKEILLPLNVHWCSVSSIKMLKTVHQRCVMRMMGEYDGRQSEDG